MKSFSILLIVVLVHGGILFGNIENRFLINESSSKNSISVISYKKEITKTKKSLNLDKKKKSFKKNLLLSKGQEGVYSEAKMVGTLSPSYPRRARRMFQEGVVDLEFVVSTSGKTRDIRIVKSSGYPLLDKEAIRSVRKAIFIPAQENSMTMTSKESLSVRFELR